MWFFYLFAFVPVVIGAVLWIKDREVTWWEWLAGSGMGFVLAALCHGAAFFSMTSDTETWSGQVTNATFYPWWKERYITTETYYTGFGKDRKAHTRLVTKYREHFECWDCRTSLGDLSGEISKAKYDEIAQVFGCQPLKTSGNRGGLVAGDPNVYVLKNLTGHIVPVVTTRSWTNRVRASPSVFSFAAVPDSIPVFAYPANPSMWVSGRLLGAAKCLGIYEWDQMNARLGPTKKVNVIMVGFPAGTDSMLGQYQEAKWFGGKKNDLVIALAGLPGVKPEWVFTFGWTEQEIVKRNLDRIVGDVALDRDLIPLIEQEIRANYVIKDWEKFDYLGWIPQLGNT